MMTNLNTPLHRQPKAIGRPSRLAWLFAVTLLLGACTNGIETDGTETGAGAGDSPDNLLDNPEAVALITPLVGLYDLPANYAGVPTSEAYLEIQAPDTSGMAIARLLKVDALNMCIDTRATTGTVTKDLFFDRVFLDRIFEFEDAILSLSGNNLIIELGNDLQDIDDDENFDEPATLSASRSALGTMASDLGSICP